jgi:metallo-beta-lactamase class B
MKKTFLSLVIFSNIHLFCDAQYGQYDTAKSVPPFKIFDNLYYVGIDWVSSYILTTSDGLILIDALYGKYPIHILQSVHDLGFDPKQIKYILCTHAHYDHYEGADTLQKLTHARVGMTEPDWQIVEGKVKTGLESVKAHLTRDLVIDDGDSLSLGNTTLKFYQTPGHTLGVLSISFPVRDGHNIYKAFVFGGAGQNFSGVLQTEMYIRSIDRILSMKDIAVNISNHPSQGKIFERDELLKQRRPGEVNPFVAPEDFQIWLQELRRQAENKLAEEKKKDTH